MLSRPADGLWPAPALMVRYDCGMSNRESSVSPFVATEPASIASLSHPAARRWPPAIRSGPSGSGTRQGRRAREPSCAPTCPPPGEGNVKVTLGSAKWFMCRTGAAGACIRRCRLSFCDSNRSRFSIVSSMGHQVPTELASVACCLMATDAKHATCRSRRVVSIGASAAETEISAASISASAFAASIVKRHTRPMLVFASR